MPRHVGIIVFPGFQLLDAAGPLDAFARSHLFEPLPVAQLAEAAGLSARQFARLLVQETGRTPAWAVEQLRVEADRIEVEAHRRSLDEIARLTKFSDTDRMRSAFLRAYGQPPQALRLGRPNRAPQKLVLGGQPIPVGEFRAIGAVRQVSIGMLRGSR